MDKKALVLEAYKTLAKFVIYGARGQPPLWPFSIVETNWYYAKFFPNEIYHTIKKLEKKGISNEKIAELCWGPSAITHWFYIIEPTLGNPALNPFEALSKKEGIEFIEKIASLLSYQRKGDIFCRDMKNILLSQDEAREVLEGKKFIEVKDNPNLIKSLRGLTMSLWHYAILIQVGHRAYSQEFHGPYPLERNKSLLIKDFFNLKPMGNMDSPVWHFSLKMPYDRIQVLEIYENAQVQIDMFNHYNVAGNLVKFYVSDGDSSIPKDKINSLANTCSQVVSEGNKTIRKFSKSDWVKQIIDLRYLWLKPHKDLLGEEWRPPQNIYKLVNKTDEAQHVATQFEKNIVSLVRGIPPEKVIEKIAEMFVEKIYNPNTRRNTL